MCLTNSCLIRKKKLDRHIDEVCTERHHSNRLSSHVVSANTIDCFKKRLDKFMDVDVREKCYKRGDREGNMLNKGEEKWIALK